MDTPTLASHFAGPVLAPLIQMKGLFSKKPNLSLLSTLYSGVAVFEQGAVLGYARNTEMETLAKLFTYPGQEKEACNAFIEATKENIEGYGHPPESFVDFFSKTVGAGLFTSYHDLSYPETLKQLSNNQVRLGMVLDWMDTWFSAGIGLGLAFPDLVKSMWQNSYETVDPERWEQARRAGLHIPEHQTPLSIEEMEKVVLSQAAEYAREYFPEVIGPLRLP